MHTIRNGVASNAQCCLQCTPFAMVLPPMHTIRTGVDFNAHHSQWCCLQRTVLPSMHTIRNGVAFNAHHSQGCCLQRTMLPSTHTIRNGVAFNAHHLHQQGYRQVIRRTGGHGFKMLNNQSRASAQTGEEAREKIKLGRDLYGNVIKYLNNTLRKEINTTAGERYRRRSMLQKKINATEDQKIYAEDQRYCRRATLQKEISSSSQLKRYCGVLVCCR